MESTPGLRIRGWPISGIRNQWVNRATALWDDNRGLYPHGSGDNGGRNEGGNGQKRAYMVRVSKHFRRTQRCDRYSSNLLLAVCPCGLRLSSIIPLPISAGLGFSSSAALRYPGSKGRYAKFLKNHLSGWLVDKFMEIYAIIAVDRQFGYKRGNLPGLNSARISLKMTHLTTVAKIAA